MVNFAGAARGHEHPRIVRMVGYTQIMPRDSACEGTDASEKTDLREKKACGVARSNSNAKAVRRPINKATIAAMGSVKQKCKGRRPVERRSVQQRFVEQRSVEPPGDDSEKRATKRTADAFAEIAHLILGDPRRIPVPFDSVADVVARVCAADIITVHQRVVGGSEHKVPNPDEQDPDLMCRLVNEIATSQKDGNLRPKRKVHFREFFKDFIKSIQKGRKKVCNADAMSASFSGEDLMSMYHKVTGKLHPDHARKRLKRDTKRAIVDRILQEQPLEFDPEAKSNEAAAKSKSQKRAKTLQKQADKVARLQHARDKKILAGQDAKALKRLANVELRKENAAPPTPLRRGSEPLFLTFYRAFLRQNPERFSMSREEIKNLKMPMRAYGRVAAEDLDLLGAQDSQYILNDMEVVDRRDGQSHGMNPSGTYRSAFLTEKYRAPVEFFGKTLPRGNTEVASHLSVIHHSSRIRIVWIRFVVQCANGTELVLYDLIDPVDGPMRKVIGEARDMRQAMNAIDDCRMPKALPTIWLLQYAVLVPLEANRALEELGYRTTDTKPENLGNKGQLLDVTLESNAKRDELPEDFTAYAMSKSELDGSVDIYRATEPLMRFVFAFLAGRSLEESSIYIHKEPVDLACKNRAGPRADPTSCVRAYMELISAHNVPRFLAATVVTSLQRETQLPFTTTIEMLKFCLLKLVRQLQHPAEADAERREEDEYWQEQYTEIVGIKECMEADWVEERARELYSQEVEKLREPTKAKPSKSDGNSGSDSDGNVPSERDSDSDSEGEGAGVDGNDSDGESADSTGDESEFDSEDDGGDESFDGGVNHSDDENDCVSGDEGDRDSNESAEESGSESSGVSGDEARYDSDESGDESAAESGDESAAESGDESAAESVDESAAESGDESAAESGDESADEDDDESADGVDHDADESESESVDDEDDDSVLALDVSKEQVSRVPHTVLHAIAKMEHAAIQHRMKERAERRAVQAWWDTKTLAKDTKALAENTETLINDVESLTEDTKALTKASKERTKSDKQTRARIATIDRQLRANAAAHATHASDLRSLQRSQVALAKDTKRAMALQRQAESRSRRAMRARLDELEAQSEALRAQLVALEEA